MDNTLRIVRLQHLLNSNRSGITSVANVFKAVNKQDSNVHSQQFSAHFIIEVKNKPFELLFSEFCQYSVHIRVTGCSSNNGTANTLILDHMRLKLRHLLNDILDQGPNILQL